MRFVRGFIVAATIVFLFPEVVPAQDASRFRCRWGISSLVGWERLTPERRRRDKPSTTAKLTQEGNVLHVTTGPAADYWNPANKASGNYTVSATFTEAKYMNLNTHPHPYGIFIAGHDLGPTKQRVILRGLWRRKIYRARIWTGPFQMNGRGEANAAVHKAAGPGEPVKQKIALSVKTERWSAPLTAPSSPAMTRLRWLPDGKLKSTDGAFWIRFAHNTEGLVTDLNVTKP